MELLSYKSMITSLAQHLYILHYLSFKPHIYYFLHHIYNTHRSSLHFRMLLHYKDHSRNQCSYLWQIQ